MNSWDRRYEENETKSIPANEFESSTRKLWNRIDDLCQCHISSPFHIFISIINSQSIFSSFLLSQPLGKLSSQFRFLSEISHILNQKYDHSLFVRSSLPLLIFSVLPLSPRYVFIASRLHLSLVLSFHLSISPFLHHSISSLASLIAASFLFNSSCQFSIRNSQLPRRNCQFAINNSQSALGN
jgi:hypothetical protein